MARKVVEKKKWVDRERIRAAITGIILYAAADLAIKNGIFAATEKTLELTWLWGE